MAALTIGRVGLDITFDTAPNIGGLGYTALPGEAVTTLAGWIHAASLAETKAIRDELYAQAEYADVVPVTYAGDSTLDGYYRVDSINVSMENYIDVGLARFTASLRRVGDSASTAFQSRLTCALRTNSRSVLDTSANLNWCWPNSAIYVSGDVTISSSGGNVVHPPGNPTSTSGTVNATFTRNTVASETIVSSTFDPLVYILPDDFYDAGCEIWGNSYLRAGLWMPDTPADWFMTNGLIRVKRDSSADSRFTIENWINGSGWESDDAWSVEYNNGSGWTDVDTWSGIRILHNRPEYAAVRLYGSWLSHRNPVVIDLAIRRGIPIIYGYLWTDSAPTSGFRVGKVSADGSTSITGGIVRTSAHADGSKWGLFSAASGVTFSTTSDYAELANPNTEMDFGIGLDLDASVNWTVNDELVDCYYGLVAENVRAVTQ